MSSATFRPETVLTRGIAATVVAAVLAIAVNAVIAAISHGAGVPSGFKPLEFGSYASLTVLGVIVAAIAWAVVRSKATRPRTILRILVPSVVVLSLVPDLVVGFGKQQAHTTWGGVAALMLMHLAVASIAVAAFAIGMPARDEL